jgi:catalase
VDLHRRAEQTNRTGGRPAHTSGLYLRGHLRASAGSDSFTSPVFRKDLPEVTVRLSPMISAAKDRPFDLHGIAVRIKPGDNAVDLTDLVALNTHPFMFRSADDFAMFLARTQQGARQIAIGIGAFGLAAVAGNASLQGMANAVVAMAGANRPLLGRSYWGIHTFFADRLVSGKTVRVPYRYRLEINDAGSGDRNRSPGKVLGKYRDIAGMVSPESPLLIDLCFLLPWRWERLVDWPNVPMNIRQQIINPIADWKHVTRIRMATLVLDEVVDTKAFEGGRTVDRCDDMVFDPTRLSSGLYPSNDPLLRARSGIYAESHMRRK